MLELWQPISGLEDRYEVSSLGAVRSIQRVEKILNRWGTYTHRPVKSRTLKPFPLNSGYLSVALKVKNKSVNRRVHRLVAEAFIGPCPSSDHVVNHINHNKLDNRLENLEWVTQSENMLAYFRHPGALRWSRHPRSRSDGGPNQDSHLQSRRVSPG